VKTFYQLAKLRRLRALCSIALLTAIIAGSSAAEPKTVSRQALNGKDGTVSIPEGTFWMGCDDPSFDNAKPLHQVHLKKFWIDKTEMTYEAFAKLVNAIRYKTLAERIPETRSVPPPNQLGSSEQI